MKRLNAPKGWSQLLFVAPSEPWAALRAAAAAGAASTTATLIAAGLRGRGGGGFLTGAKWQAAAAEPQQHAGAAAGGQAEAEARGHMPDVVTWPVCAPSGTAT